MGRSPEPRVSLRHARLSRPGMLALVLVAMTQAACGAWVRIPAPGPALMPPQQRVQVWRGSESWILTGVSIGTDSLWGAPLQATGEPAGRLALARAEVDSFRVESGSQGTTPFFAFVGGFILALELLLRGWRT